MKQIYILLITSFSMNVMFAQSELAAKPTSLDLSDAPSTLTPVFYPGCNSDKIDLNTCTFNLFNKDFNAFLQLNEVEKPECETQIMSLILDVDTDSNITVKEIEGEVTEKYRNLITEKIPEFSNYLKTNNNYIFPATNNRGFVNSSIKIPYVIHSKGYHEFETFTKNEITYKTFLNCYDYYVYNASKEFEIVDILHSESEYLNFKNNNTISLNSENLKSESSSEDMISTVKVVERSNEKITQFELEQQKLNETKEAAIQEAIKAKQEAKIKEEIEKSAQDKKQALAAEKIQKELEKEAEKKKKEQEREATKAKIKELKESLKN